MKMLSSTAYDTYGKLCRALRSRGVKLGFYEMSACAELALLLDEGDTDRAHELAEKLDVDVAELGTDELRGG